MVQSRRICAIILGRCTARPQPTVTCRDSPACWRKWRAILAARPPRARVSGLDQTDALLITYADQVSAPGEPPLRTLTAFARTHLRGIVSGLHLLPFYPSSSDDGFAVTDYYAVDPHLGTWADIAELGADFDLMFDAVFNHLSAQSEWFARWRTGDPEFHDFFITVDGNPDLSAVVRPRALPLLTEFATAAGPRRVWTTFSADQVDLNFRNSEVLLRTVDALLFYVSRGARFLRLDAVAFLWKEIGTTCLHRPQTHRIIQLWRAVLDALAPEVRLITETNVPHADNVAYFGDGTNEAHLVYNFALPPLMLHAVHTGDTRPLTRWAHTLSLPSAQVAFFNFLASHDGIGLNPARGLLSDGEIDALAARALAHGGFVSHKSLPDGSRQPYELNINFLDALSAPAGGESLEIAARKMLVAHAVMLALPGVPGLYFHSLFGSRGDRAGAEQSGVPRRINRAQCARAAAEAELAQAGSLRARVLGGLGALLRRRRACGAFAPAAPCRVLELRPDWFALERRSADGRELMWCVHNLSAEEGAAPCRMVRPSSSGRMRLHGGPGAELSHRLATNPATAPMCPCAAERNGWR